MFVVCWQHSRADGLHKASFQHYRASSPPLTSKMDGLTGPWCVLFSVKRAIFQCTGHLPNKTLLIWQCSWGNKLLSRSWNGSASSRFEHWHFFFFFFLTCLHKPLAMCLWIFTHGYGVPVMSNWRQAWTQHRFDVIYCTDHDHGDVKPSSDSIYTTLNWLAWFQRRLPLA